MDVTPVLEWFQEQALAVLFIIAIIYVLGTMVWKRAYIAGVIGLAVMGFAGVIISNPETMVVVGQWLADMVSWG